MAQFLLGGKSRVANSGITPISIKFKESSDCIDQENSMDNNASEGRISIVIWASAIWNVFILKFCTSVMDIGTDLVSGCNYINGNFPLMLFALTTPEDPDVNYPEEHLTWGVLSLMSAWIPGIVDVCKMMVTDQWNGSWWKILQKVLEYILLLLIWPINSVLM